MTVAELRRSVLAACAVLCASLPQPASPARAAPPQTVGDVVVVRGRRPGVDALIRQTHAITRTYEGQLTRFEEAVCPQVTGLSEASDAVLLRSLQADIGLAGATVDGPGCAPNLVVVLAGDGRGFVRALAKRNPTLFSAFDLHARERFVASAGPVWAWKSTVPRRRDGGPVHEISSISFSPNDPPHPLAPGAYIASNVEHGRLISPVRRDIATSIVVIQLSALEGLTLQQIADYCALVGLGPIDPARSSDLAAPSILSLFGDDADRTAAPPGLTGFDLAYLHALYSGSTGYSADQKLTTMSIEMMRELKAEAAVDDATAGTGRRPDPAPQSQLNASRVLLSGSGACAGACGGRSK